MTRIGTLGANTTYVNQILDLQSQINQSQLQMSSQLKAQTYSGIAADANTLLNYQTEAEATQQFITGNQIASTTLNAASTTIDSISASLKNFQTSLNTFFSGNTTSQANVENIQTAAFSTMVDMQSYLAANINGQYVFSGGRVNTEPVDLPAGTLAGFQAIYDGSNKTWPTSRTAQLLQTTVSRQASTSLSFVPASGIITSASAAALTPLATGAVVTVSNSVANNQDYQVHSHAAMNVGGTALAEGTSASLTSTISYGSTPTNLTTAAGAPGTGPLTFAFAPDGNMTISPTNANAMAAMTAGTTFTLNGTTGNAWDGAYKVVSNLNNVVEIATDTNQALSESVAQTAAAAPLSMSFTAAGVTTALPLTTGTVTMTATPSAAAGNTSVTVTGAGAADFAAVAVGNTVTIGGSADHNGTFTVTAKTANSVTFTINSDALRVSKFLPQTGRADVTVSFGGSTGIPANTVTAAANTTSPGYGTLTFSPVGTTGERITGSNGATSFKDNSGNPYPAVGAVIHLTSTSGVNDGVYTVTANNGGNIEVQSVQITAEAGTTTADLSVSSWYKGDSLQIQHRADQNDQVDVGIYASDTAFEKAFRALGLIAEGTYGTAGGLDQNQSRINQAMYLLSDSLSSPAEGTPPFGPEQRGDVTALSSRLGFTQNTLKNTIASQTNFLSFLQGQATDITQADQNTVATNLLSQSNALQASYQTLAKISGLSLMNYLK